MNVFNWLFGPNSAIGKLFGSKPAPKPPVLAPVASVPVPTATKPVAIIVLDGQRHPVSNAVVALSGANTYPVTNSDGYSILEVPMGLLTTTLTINAVGFQAFSTGVTLPNRNQDLIVAPAGQSLAADGHQQLVGALVAIAPPVPVWTKDQLLDLQGDLMLWMPELPLSACPETGIKTAADNGAVPAGILNGWIWLVWIPLYSAEHRQQIYAKIKSYGFTHAPLCVGEVPAGSTGYHGLQTAATQAQSDGYGALVNLVYDEMVVAGLIPVVAGPAPGPASQGGANVAIGFDCSKVQVCMSDWDNTTYGAERIKYLSDTFPKAWIYYERPGDQKRPSGMDKSPNVPNTADNDLGNGGQWLKDMQMQCPRFVGVMYEINNWPGGNSVDACAAEMQMAHDGFWRDVLEVLFETNTYDKFWNGQPMAAYDALDAQLRAKVLFMKGFFSGGVTHAPVTAAPVANTVVVGAATDMIPVGSIQFVSGPDIGAFALTTKISQLNISPAGIECVFDKRDAPNNWPDTAPAGGTEPGIKMGALNYSIGVACKVNGQWVASAPVETWTGRNVLGGNVTLQDIADGTGRGQFAANWFYDARWGALNGYNPKPGEEIGVFVCAGDARNNYCPIQERSNIVLIPMVAPGQSASYSWSV
jgi:hypothetical protein